MPTITYYNGEYLSSGQPAVPVEERGHQFGDGVYEVVRIYGGRPFLLEWHLDRLERSLKMIGLDNPMHRDAWTSLIHDAIRRSHELEANVYFHVTRGIAPRNHLFGTSSPATSLTVRPIVQRATESANEDAGKRLLAWPDERWANAYVKSINLLPNVIAKEAAHRIHAHEAMLVRDGVVTECAGSNMWFVREGELWTHPANRYILGGITRQFVLQLASKLNITVHEEAVLLKDLGAFQAAFITSTTNEILPVDEILVYALNEQDLYQLPNVPPTSLIESSGELRSLWKKTVNPSSEATRERLMGAYEESVEGLRNGALQA